MRVFELRWLVYEVLPTYCFPVAELILGRAKDLVSDGSGKKV